MGRQWPDAGSGDLNTTILGVIGHADTSPFKGGHNYAYHSLASGQTTGQKHSPTHLQKIGLKSH